ncbi:calcium-binding protein, partial [uncultured Methylobacterium sp.]|uniref:calcium-binding protein n=1 Tax=uncultured Methylobacterium sp. TaxID=157278 RepID=UPI0025958D11
GNNVLDGGVGGADLINGLGGIDTVSYANSASRVVIDLNRQLTWDGTDNDTLVSIENAIGSRFNDDVLGDAGNNVLDGGVGGADLINGLGGIDTVSYANSASRVVIDLNRQLTWDGTDNDTLASIENAIGSRFNDDVLGDAGNNVLDGGVGGADFINGLGGIDTVSYASSLSGTVIDLNAQLTWDGTDNDTLVSIENAIGSRFNDTLIGGSGDNVLTGGGGSDTFLFIPLAGRDLITDFQAGAGTGADVLAYRRGVFTNDDPLRNAVQSGSDVVFSTARNGSITLLGVNLNDLTANNFLIS